MKQVNNKVCDIYLNVMIKPLGKLHKSAKGNFAQSSTLLRQLMPRRMRILIDLYDFTTQLGEFEI